MSLDYSRVSEQAKLVLSARPRLVTGEAVEKEKYRILWRYNNTSGTHQSTFYTKATWYDFINYYCLNGFIPYLWLKQPKGKVFKNEVIISDIKFEV